MSAARMFGALALIGCVGLVATLLATGTLTWQVGVLLLVIMGLATIGALVERRRP